MARRTTKMVKYDEELAKQAALVQQQEETALGSAWFSLRGGTLAFNGAPLADNRVLVIIAGFIFENIFYDTDFDPDNPASPACYAFGTVEKELVPHDDARDKQNVACVGCEQNKWGSSDRGRGKACRNTRRLALLSAGGFDGNGRPKLISSPDDMKGSPFGFLKIPVTSVKGWGQYVQSLANVYRRPPHGVVTEISVVSDPQVQFRMLFKYIDNVPNELLPVVMERHEEALEAITFPYVESTEEAPAARGRRKTTKKKTTKKKRGGKY